MNPAMTPATMLVLPALAAVLLITVSAAFAEDVPATQPNATQPSSGPLAHAVTDIEGNPVDLAIYRGKVVLFVNVASRCGFTKQYKGLEALYKEFKDDGLVILGFPCNQFGKQEPGTEAEIAQFCHVRFGVTFPLFSKIEVNGEGADPLYKYLTSEEPDIKDTGPIKWNFEKFLVGRDGNVTHRFRSRVTPESDMMRNAIKAALSKPTGA